MKIQIRQGVFETNSSSTHTIAIARSITEDNIDYPSPYCIYGYNDPWANEFVFGRDNDFRNTMGRRIAYAVMAVLEAHDNNWPVEERREFYEKILNIVKKHGTDAEWNHIDEILERIRNVIQLCEHEEYLYSENPEYVYTGKNELIEEGCAAFIDHGYGLKDFARILIENDEALERFIMCENSFVYTGGDESNGYFVPRAGFEYDYDNVDQFMKRVNVVADELNIDLFLKGN